MNEQEKRELINFYRENPILWKNDDPDHNNKQKRLAVKDNLYSVFDGKHTMEVLEKTFHSLRTCMSREIKKENESDPPKKKWKFYEDMVFLKEEISMPRKKLNFEATDIEMLINYYQLNPSLWNHNLVEYRDRILRDALLDKCVEELDNRYSKDEIKQQWNNLVTTYKREYMRQEASKCSGSGTKDVYVSDLEYFNSMTFIEATCNVDESFNTIGESIVPPSEKQKKESKSDRISAEQNAKLEVWKALASSLTSPTASVRQEEHQSTQGEPNLCDRAQLFGRTVADSLM